MKEAAVQAESTSDGITDINITPLVDVALVLVIIFMVTMPFLMEKAMKVKSSSEQATAVSSINDPILVELTQDAITIDGRGVTLEELAPALAKLMRERGVSAVAVSAEPGTTHGRVVQVLDNAISSGAQDLNLLQPKEGSRGNL